jgi:glutathione peroxidase
MLLRIVVGVVIVVVIGGLGAAYAMGVILTPSPSVPPKAASLYEFTLKNIDGSDVKLETFRGKVILIVNTASKCGLTPQYEALQKIYDRFKDKDFVVVGFPANNFLGQEPGTEKEIKEFCTLNYKVTFPMFSKISVKGADQHPLYSFLTNEKTNPGFSGDITWNFEKFLIGKDGKTVARYAPRVLPDDPKVIEEIEKLLNK